MYARRHRMKAILAIALGLGLLLTACGSSKAANTAASLPAGTAETPVGPITFGSVGGSLGNALAHEAAVFTQQTGIKVNIVQGTADSLLAQVEAEKGNPKIDVMLSSETAVAEGADRGIFAPVNAHLIPDIRYLYPEMAAGEYGVPVHVAAEGIEYNTKAYAKAGIPPPTSLADLLNPKLKGHVSVFPPNGNYGLHLLLLAALANGGSMSNVQPGFEFLKRLKESGNWAFTPGTPAENDTLVSQGAAWAAYTSDLRADALAAQGLPIAFVAPQPTGAVAAITPMVVMNHAPHEAAAFKFVNFFLSPPVQAYMAQAAFVGPTSTQTVLTPAVAKFVIYGDAEVSKLYKVDDQAVAEDSSQWVTDWNQELG